MYNKTVTMQQDCFVIQSLIKQSLQITTDLNHHQNYHVYTVSTALKCGSCNKKPQWDTKYNVFLLHHRPSKPGAWQLWARP